MPEQPRIETIPAWRSAGIRRVVPMSEISSAFDKTFPAVAEAIAVAGGQLLPPAYARYTGMPTDTVDVEIGFGVQQPVEAPELVVTDNPAVRAVVYTHIGPYERLAESYAVVEEWFATQDLGLADAMWEFYDSPPGTDPEKSVTRMVFPLA